MRRSRSGDCSTAWRPLPRDLPQPVFVQSGSTPFDAAGCEVAPFLAMSEFERRVAQSTLLIMHAGAGSVITAVRAGKVPVVMPRRARFGEHVDDHQVEFARELAAAGRIVVAERGGGTSVRGARGAGATGRRASGRKRARHGWIDRRCAASSCEPIAPAAGTRRAAVFARPPTGDGVDHHPGHQRLSRRRGRVPRARRPADRGGRGGALPAREALGRVPRGGDSLLPEGRRHSPVRTRSRRGQPGRESQPRPEDRIHAGPSTGPVHGARPDSQQARARRRGGASARRLSGRVVQRQRACGRAPSRAPVVGVPRVAVRRGDGRVGGRLRGFRERRVGSRQRHADRRRGPDLLSAFARASSIRRSRSSWAFPTTATSTR